MSRTTGLLFGALLLGGLLVWLVAMPLFPRVAKPERTSSSDTRSPRPSLRGADAPAPDDAGAHASDTDAPDVIFPTWPIAIWESVEVGSGRIVVRLVDSSGRSLAHHPIGIGYAGGVGTDAEQQGVTDAVGACRTYVDDPRDIMELRVPARDAYALYTVGEEFVLSPSAPDEVLVEVPTTVLLRGRVFDRRGNAVVAKVVADARGAWSPVPFANALVPEERSASSGADGRFELALVVGAYDVGIEHPAGLARGARVVFTADRRVLDVELLVDEPPRGRRLVVQVRGVPPGRARHLDVSARAATEAVPGPASPGVSPTRPAWRWGRHQGGATWAVEGLDERPWMLTVEAPSRGRLEVPVPPGATRLDVDLGQATGYAGPAVVVVGLRPDGTTVKPRIRTYEGAWLRPSGRGRPQGPRPEVGEVVALEEGEPRYLLVDVDRTALAGLGPLSGAGRAEAIEVPLEPGRQAAVELRSASGDPVPAAIAVEPPWSFFLTPGRDGRLHSSDRDGYAPLDLRAAARTAPGSWKLSRLGPRTYRVKVFPDDLSLPRARGEVGVGEVLALQPGRAAGPLTTLRLRLVDGRTGRGVPHADLSVEPGEGPWTGDIVRGRSDADGRCLLPHQPLARSIVRVRVPPGYAFHRLVEVPAEAMADEVEIALTPATALWVRVVDDQGRPVEGADVEVQDAAGTYVFLAGRRGEWYRHTSTDVLGRVYLPGVPLGEIRLSASPGDDPERRAVVTRLVDRPLLDEITIRLP